MSTAKSNALWDALVEDVDHLDLGDFKVSYNDKKASRHVQLYPRYVMNDKGAIHYEWLLRKDAHLDVALHFEFATQQLAERYLDLLRPHESAIRKGVRYPFKLECHAPRSSQVCFVLPYDAAEPAGVAAEAARVMVLLVERTWPILEPTLPRDRSLV